MVIPGQNRICPVLTGFTPTMIRSLKQYVSTKNYRDRTYLLDGYKTPNRVRKSKNKVYIESFVAWLVFHLTIDGIPVNSWC